MANADFTGTADQHETKGAKAIFEPFTWGHRAVDKPGVELPANGLMGLARGVKDIAAGVALILDIAHFDSDRQVENDSEEPSIIRDGDHRTLQRMAIASLGLLERNADHLMEWAYDYHTKEGQQERRALAGLVRPATAVEQEVA